MTDELCNLIEGLRGLQQEGREANAHFLRYIDLLGRRAEAAQSEPVHSPLRTHLRELCRHLHSSVRRFAERMEDRLYWQQRWIAAAQEGREGGVSNSPPRHRSPATSSFLGVKEGKGSRPSAGLLMLSPVDTKP